MSGRQYQPYINNSLAIRQEIQRFESVHPSIYAIYDLIELIPDAIISQQVREHVVCIEDSFVNSQEWTLSRTVPDLRLGIVGSLSSGKSALVHRYLTGSYMQEESPEGGRFKKEVQLDGQSYLLLIRDEGGPPEIQFSAWVDAVIFVFSLESEASFNAIYSFYTKMAQFRNSSEVPLLLVGTQDAISETSPRVIDDARARKLAADLKCSGYYETCATYGLAVQQVFLDACLRIVQSRLSNSIVGCGTPNASRPTTPIHGSSRYHPPSGPPNHVQCSPSPSHKVMGFQETLSRQVHSLSASSHQLYRHSDGGKGPDSLAPGSYATLAPALPLTPVDLRDPDRLTSMGGEGLTPPMRDKDLPTPTSTPTTTRKSRRRSNLFTSSKKTEDKSKNGELGSGRAIPLKQGFLYKRSSKSLKEWKKKYVALCDGMLTYFPNLQDYMEDVHGKQVPLQFVTVKMPGQKPRGSRTTLPSSNGLTDGLSNLSISSYLTKDRRLQDGTREPGEDGYLCFTNGSHLRPDVASNAKQKRHRRIKSSGLKTGDADEPDGYEFLIVSLDNKQWHFEAGSIEERDDWVTAIEQQILVCLQGGAGAGASGGGLHVDAVGVQAVRQVSGNSHCADCSAPNPEWASLNLGLLVCIECSGIHRNLGSHVTKIRSLHLDEWPPGHLSVMLNLGNTLANSVWESGSRGARPTPTSTRDEKERWIRRKYEAKEFLMPAPSQPIGPEMVDAVCRSDIHRIYQLLAYASPEDINYILGERDTRTPLHLACALGNLAIVQLLLWYGANVQNLDQDGRSCLVYARAAGGVDCNSLIELLLAADCPDTGSLKMPHTVI